MKYFLRPKRQSLHPYLGDELTDKDYLIYNEETHSHRLDFNSAKPIFDEDDEKKKAGMGWGRVFVVVLLSIIFGLSAGANNAASTIRALPVMVSMAPVWLQVTVSSISVLGALMNFGLILMNYPALLTSLKKKFWGSKYKPSEISQLSRKKKALITISGVFTFLTCAGIGFFTFESVPTVIVGISALFGATLAPSLPWILAIAGVLAVLQAMTSFIILFNDTVGIIANASWRNLKKFFMIGEFAPKDKREHSIRAGRVIMNTIGAGILLLAGAFMIFGQASATYSTLVNWNLDSTLSTIITGALVYVIASLSHFAIRVCSAHGIFGKFGDWLGNKIGYYFLSKDQQNEIDYQESVRKAKKVHVPFRERGFAHKVQTVMKKIWPLTFLALLANTIGEAFSGMRGDHLLHEGTTTDGSSFHTEADKIAANPAYLFDAKTEGVGSAEIASGAINGAASATIVSYLCFANDVSNTDTKQKKQAVEDPLHERQPYSYRTDRYNSGFWCSSMLKDFAPLDYSNGDENHQPSRHAEGLQYGWL